MRVIWGKSDTTLFIFAGASAEFALNKAVDWLYYTGRLPADPLGRLFSTVLYARDIVFADEENALKAIDRITAIHRGVEGNRGYAIPAWAYRDVLFMLIHYSIASFELLERPLLEPEKQEVFQVFFRVGQRMGIPDLPPTYAAWTRARMEHISRDLARSHYTVDLFRQYRRHLGRLRYVLLREVQRRLVPDPVRRMLDMQPFSWLPPVLFAYKASRSIHLDRFLKSLLVPRTYLGQIRELDIQPVAVSALHA